MNLAFEIQELVCRHFGISRAEMLSNRRMRLVVRPRQTAMWLCRHHTELSLPEIGREFNRDHTTVSYAISAVDRAIEHSNSFADEVQFLSQEITALEANGAPARSATRITEQLTDFTIRRLRSRIEAEIRRNPFEALQKLADVFSEDQK